MFGEERQALKQEELVQEGVLQMFDISGREMFSTVVQLVKGKKTLKPDIKMFPQGIYILKLITNSGEVDRKLILE